SCPRTAPGPRSGGLGTIRTDAADPLPLRRLRQPHPLRRHLDAPVARLSPLLARRRADRRGLRGAVGGGRAGGLPLVRLGVGGRGARAGRHRQREVTGLTAADDLVIRPALEAAVAVARAGEEEVPVRPAPSALRPFLQFSRLPARARSAARRVLEGDA